MATMRVAHMKAATAKSTAKNVKVHIKSFEKKIRTLKPFLQSTVILIEKNAEDSRRGHREEAGRRT